MFISDFQTLAEPANFTALGWKNNFSTGRRQVQIKTQKHSRLSRRNCRVRLASPISGHGDATPAWQLNLIPELVSYSTVGGDGQTVIISGSNGNYIA
jgi:hypothetical protein